MRTTRQLGTSTTAVLISIVIIVGYPVRDALAQDVTLEQIADAWRSREQVPSWQLKWKQTRTDVKGSVPLVIKLLRKELDEDEVLKIFPSEDTTWDNEITLAVADTRWRYEYEGFRWYLDKLLPYSNCHAFNGQQHRQLLGQNFHGDFKEGLLHKGEERFLAGQTTLPVRLPVSWCFWPLDPDRGGIDIKNAELLEDTLRIDETDLIGIEERVRFGTCLYWIDVDDDYVIRRAERFTDGLLRAVVSAKYRRDGNVRIPDSWEVQTFFGDNMQLQHQFVCTDVRFVKRPVNPEGFFDLEFPTHSVVYDRQTNVDYVVKSDGEWFRILKGTRDVGELIRNLSNDEP